MPSELFHVFRYPENVGQPPVDKWILFEVKSGRHIIRRKNTPEGGKNDRTLSAVALYLPEGALKTQIQSQWQKADIGVALGSAIEALNQTPEDIFKGISDLSIGAASSQFQGVLNKLSNVDFSSGTIIEVLKGALNLGGKAAQASILNGFNEHFGEAAAAAFGARVNPKTDLLYQSTEYRTHEFEFILTPRNKREADSINEIIKFFQFYMLPSFGADGTLTGTGALSGISAALIGFPYEFEITISRGALNDAGRGETLRNVNRIGRSALTTCGIDHAAAGKVSFIRSDDEFYPVATKLSLSFQEVQILGRDSKEITDLTPTPLDDPRST